jgi:hypothetical protein
MVLLDYLRKNFLVPGLVAMDRGQPSDLVADEAETTVLIDDTFL